MIMTEEEIELYRWINACPEAALSYKEKDGTRIIEIQIDEQESERN